MNDSDPPIALPDDQVTLAQNVEFNRSTLGERRRGAEAINLTGSPFTGCDRCVWTHRHLPTSDASDAQFWALCIDDTGPTAVLAYKDTTWHTVAMTDALTIDGVSEYQVNAVSLHGKLFIAYNSAVDRLHVWDGSSLRRVGLLPPAAAPTSANFGSGSFTTTRYYRTRETIQDADGTILRSEPSDVLTDAPSGTGEGITVTKPATVNSGVSHWELEASLDNANFYTIATTVIGTTTANDTTSAATGYAVEFDLSEDIGDYEVPHSAKRLQADEDRLVLYGSWEDSELSSAMSWTPVHNATGVGNDERITLDPVSVINLDGFEGGEITDESSAVAGELWVFKDYHSYKVIRTGILTRAYEPITVSKRRGAIRGSVVEGIDEAGNPALYFIDPAAGPCRTVRGGIQTCGRDIWETFQTINLDATKVQCVGWYYPTNRQVHWRIATGSSNIPVIGLCLQTNEMRVTDSGEARRGFSVWTGAQCEALTAVLYSDNIDAGTARSHTLVPYIGVEDSTLIWRLDTGDDDNGTEYTARITTKPFAPTQLQTDFEIKTAKLVGKSVQDATLVVSAIPNFGTETSKAAGELDFSPIDDEAHQTKFMDDLGIAGCEVAQIDFADATTPGARWELSRMTMTIVAGLGS
jgi:hypothetical protein